MGDGDRKRPRKSQCWVSGSWAEDGDSDGGTHSKTLPDTDHRKQIGVQAEEAFQSGNPRAVPWVGEEEAGD